MQKAKKKDVPLPASFCCSESYSPTTPVRRPTDDFQSNIVGTYCPSQDSLIENHESYYDDQEARLSQSPTFPVYTQADPPYYTSTDPVQCSPAAPCFGSSGAHSTASVFSAAQASTSVPAAMLDQGKSSPAHNPEMTTYPTLLENESLGHAASSPRVPGIVAAGSSVGTDLCMLKQNFPDDPSTWTVEEVILFLQQADPETLAPLADIFRQHDIDGAALLLLQSEIMIKYMGIKLGTALKVCHYIEKLKVEKGIED